MASLEFKPNIYRGPGLPRGGGAALGRGIVIVPVLFFWALADAAENGPSVISIVFISCGVLTCMVFPGLMIASHLLADHLRSRDIRLGWQTWVAVVPGSTREYLEPWVKLVLEGHGIQITSHEKHRIHLESGIIRIVRESRDRDATIVIRAPLATIDALTIAIGTSHRNMMEMAERSPAMKERFSS